MPVRAVGCTTTSRKWLDEFLRRFLLHVLPPGFVKLRHYGPLAPGNVNGRLVAARALLERATPPPAPSAAETISLQATSDWRVLLRQLTGIDVTSCKKCGGHLASKPIRRPSWRDSS